MAIYYHVSTQLTHSGFFKPKIPEHRHKESEDSKTARVCVAPTIEDCLTAIPMGGVMLAELCAEMRNYFLVFRIDTEKLKINNSDIVSSEELFKKDMVRDAEMTNEHWITVPFTVSEEDRFFILVSNWKEEPYDVIPFSVYKIADEKFKGNYFEAYEAIYNNFIPSSTQIQNLEYVSEKVNKGNTVCLYYDYNDNEKSLIINYIKKHNLPLALNFESMDELVFTIKEDTNLRDLFLYHYMIT